MITLHGFSAGFGLPEIAPFATRTQIQLKRALRRAQTEVQRALARTLGRMIEYYVCCALAGAHWANPQDLTGGKCCDSAS
jgi:hypothetical protein